MEKYYPYVRHVSAAIADGRATGSYEKVAGEVKLRVALRRVAALC